jgi:hypothetical protein
LLSGVAFEGNAESKMGRGTLYATASYGRSAVRRYDFVTVKVEQETDNEATIRIQLQTQLVALIEIIQDIQDIEDIEMVRHEMVRHAAVVLYLEEYKEKDKKNAAESKKRKKTPIADTTIASKTREEYFPKYKWEIGSYQGKKPVFAMDIVDIQCLVGPAIVIPDFAANKGLCGNPVATDRFYYVRGEWIDRSGYVDDDGLELPELHLGSDDPSAIEQFIRTQQTTRNGITQRNLFDMEAITAEDLNNNTNGDGNEDHDENDDDDDDDDDDEEEEEEEEEDNADEMGDLDVLLDIY